MTDWFGPIHMVQPIYGIILPLLSFTTLIFNSMIILVLTRPCMKSATNTVLMGMAACDLVTIILPAPWYFSLYTLDQHEELDWGVAGCYLFDLMVDIVPQMFHTASNWLTLALAVQRYIFVCHPTLAKTWCTVTKSSKLVGLVVSLAILTTSSRIVDRTYFVWATPDSGLHSCHANFSSWVLFLGPTVYFNCFYWFRVVCVHLVPCVSLVILNILLFSAIRKAERRRQKLMASRVKAEQAGLVKSGNRDNKRQRDAYSTTMMLIVVIAVFLSVETPLMVITALHTISSSVTDFLDYDLAKRLVFIINLCIYLSYPLNFAIYCGMSRQFRDTFRLIIVTPVVKKFSSNIKMDQQTNENEDSSTKLTKSRRSTIECSRSPNLSTKTCTLTVSQK